MVKVGKNIIIIGILLVLIFFMFDKCGDVKERVVTKIDTSWQVKYDTFYRNGKNIKYKKLNTDYSLKDTGYNSEKVNIHDTPFIVNDYNHFYKVVSLNNDWQEYVISFSYFAQNSWGKKVDLMTALEKMVAIKFKAYPQLDGVVGNFQIDEIWLVSGDMGTGTTSDPITYPKDKVIADFQNGTGQNSWGGYNYSYDDNGIPNFGNSEITMSILNDGGSKVAFVSYDVNTAFPERFVGVGFGLDVSANNPQDISRFSGIKFRAKGSATINIEVNSTVYSDYNRHSKQVTVNSGAWNTYYVYFTDMSQENNWGNKVELIDVLKKALAVQLKIGKTNDKGQISIDDVEFFHNTPQNVQHLSADVVGASSNISWDTSIGATAYLVVRNITDYPNPGSYPVNRFEGTSKLVTGNTFAEPLIDGKAYYYSVFAYNDQVDLYSAAKIADKPLRIIGGLFAASSILTVNEIIYYSQNNSSYMILRNNDYVNSSFTLKVTVDSVIATTTNNIKLVVKAGNTTINEVSFAPTFNSNLILIPITLSVGLTDIKISAIDWFYGDSNLVQKSVIVADNSDSVALKSGSKILCYPMPYNPSLGNMDIAYELTIQSDVEIYVYNLLGQVVWKNLFYKGLNGGTTGYNQVSFDGEDAFRDKLAIGMYFIQIVHGKSVLGTSKFLVTR